jgi:hypothetical protein
MGVGGEKPLEPDYKLHWTSTAYTLEDGSAKWVDIDPGSTWALDLCFAILEPPPQRTRTVEVPMVTPDAGTAAVEIMQGYRSYWWQSPQEESQLRQADREAWRLKRGAGCWVAIPLALSRPDLAGQAYLPPGEYRLQVRVLCDTGEEPRIAVNLTSPKPGRGCIWKRNRSFGRPGKLLREVIDGLFLGAWRLL